jgi:hypothetical protein
MRVLADATFPASIALPTAAGVEVVRYDGAAIDDAQLLRYAAEAGFAAVLLLGRDSIADGSIVEEARGLAITIIVTVSENPLEAAAQVRPRLGDIHLRSGDDPVVTMGKTGPIDRDARSGGEA